ncbi:Uncharacterized protein OBRU01_12954, partial [Operophtera brumata]
DDRQITVYSDTEVRTNNSFIRSAGQWAGSPGVDGEYLDTARVSAVTGGDATLPCDTHSPQPSDLLLLVVWYKDDVPVYSYDGRIKGPSANWADEMLAGRTDWHAAVPSTLHIRNIVPEDRALYRCRVDFKISPTMNQKILLDVIELPAKPKVFNELEKEMIGFVGPYVEGTSMKLTCVVSGGKPKPRVRWWRDDKVVSTLSPVDDGSRSSLLDLRISKLTRDYHEAVYSCTADNTALCFVSVRPLSVEILTREQPLSVRQTAEVACRAVGARPPAVISWLLDNEKLDSIAQKNETLSILRWTPHMKNNGQTLTCRASHAVLKHAVINTSLLLNLHYVPIVVLKLGSELNPGDIEEGDDVYFTCVVRAYPPAYKVVWEHNENTTFDSGKSSLLFTPKSEADYGIVSCQASNSGGRQAQPCRFVIHRPYNCSTLNMTDDSHLPTGYDGSLHTSYCVEAWESGNLVLNVSTSTPIWKLRGLGSGKTLKLVFYASKVNESRAGSELDHEVPRWSVRSSPVGDGGVEAHAYHSGEEPQ